MSAKAVPLFIDWHGVNQPEEMKKTYKYTMVLGATSPKVETPEPVVIEKVVEKIVEKPVEKIVVKEAEEEFQEDEEEPELDLIAPAKPFGTVTERKAPTASEGCSAYSPK